LIALGCTRASLMALVLCASALLPAAVAAQQPDTVRAQHDTTVVVIPVPEKSPTSSPLPEIERATTPGGAFVRALLLPGWGHAAIGAYTRGGFYFAAQTTSGFLLIRSIHRLGIANQERDLKESRLREALIAKGVTGDSALATALASDPDLAKSVRFVRSRHQQVEDWAALAIFMTFVSGADAYVSAHLRDFPSPLPLSLEVAPGDASGRVSLGLKAAVGSRPPSR
jgi:hypothetical protein